VRSDNDVAPGGIARHAIRQTDQVRRFVAFLGRASSAGSASVAELQLFAIEFRRLARISTRGTCFAWV
jgi:hypothetical protein